MRRLKHFAIASAVAASFATTAHGQAMSTLDPQTGIRSGTAVITEDDTRVFEAIRSTERNEIRATETRPINAAELARARAAGEIKTNEDNPAGVRELTQLHAGANNGQPQVVDAKPQLNARIAAEAAGSGTAKNRPGGAIVYLADPKPAGRLQLSEAARASEHARYEANKRRGSIAATEQARARINEQARAGEMHTGSSSQSGPELRSSDLSRSGFIARERAISPSTEAVARANDRAAPPADGISDERAARDILSRLR